MPPPLVVAVFHLRLEEASKDSSSSPTHAVTLLYAALDDGLAVSDDVDVGPDAVAQNLVQFEVCIVVLLKFCTSEEAPESFATSVAVLGQSPCTNGQL